jgi:hypothetical protein
MAIKGEMSPKEKKNRKSNPGSFFQAKLKVNKPGDKYEQEAEAMAEKVMRMDTAENIGGTVFPKEESISREIGEEEVTLQMKTTPGGKVSDAMDSEIKERLGNGKPLPSETLAIMEDSFGRAFGKVNIHDDAKADYLSKSIQANAFTVGNDIFFREGEFTPKSTSGKKLLAHELTHVLQQGSQRHNNVQRNEEENSSTESQDTSFEFDYNILPPSLQFTLGQWMLEANTSSAALQFTSGLIRTRFGYNYGGEMTLRTQGPRTSGQFGYDPASTRLSLNLTHDQFRVGSTFNPSSGAIGLNLGYGAPLLPMPFELGGSVHRGWEGASNVLGNLGTMGDPLAFYRSHENDVDSVMATVKALSPLANDKNRSFGAGLRFTYDPQSGVLIYGGMQWFF